MKSKIVWTLVAVNVLLLGAWLGRIQPQAMAQNRRVADYIAIPGEIVQTDSGVVYLIDQTNGQLSAMSYDPSRSKLDVMPPIDLNRVFEPEQVKPPKKR